MDENSFFSSFSIRSNPIATVTTRAHCSIIQLIFEATMKEIYEGEEEKKSASRSLEFVFDRFRSIRGW